MSLLDHRSFFLTSLLSLCIAAPLAVAGCAAPTDSEASAGSEEDVAETQDELTSTGTQLVGSYWTHAPAFGGFARLSLGADGKYTASVDAGGKVVCVMSPCELSESGTWNAYKKASGGFRLRVRPTGESSRWYTATKGGGAAVTLGGPRLKDAAGLSLTKLFVGSEGTLGIITEVTLRLIPARGQASTLVATFATLGDATQTVIDITRSIRPSMLEFMDSITINAVEDLTKMGLDRSAAAMLIIQSDEPAETANREIALMSDLCNANNSTEVYFTDDPDESDAFVMARRMVLPAIERLGTILLEDVGVPVSRLGDLVLNIAEISQKYEIPVPVVAHAGDGNTHPQIVFDPSVPGQQERAQAAFGEIMELAIALGGTISGEHGVGRLKRPWLPSYLGDDAMALNQRIKSALDPQNILNPGSMFSA